METRQQKLSFVFEDEVCYLLGSVQPVIWCLSLIKLWNLLYPIFQFLVIFNFAKLWRVEFCRVHCNVGFPFARRGSRTCSHGTYMVSVDLGTLSMCIVFQCQGLPSKPPLHLMRPVGWEWARGWEVRSWDSRCKLITWMFSHTIRHHGYQ